MSGVPVALHTEATAVADGVMIAIPPSITNHTLFITGNDAPSAGAVQPEVSADGVNFAPVGGGPITVVDGTIEYNFQGAYPFIQCPITTEITSGDVDVKYVGTHA